jgi:leucyl-tRNA synthetase
MVPVPYDDLPVFLPKDVSFDGLGNPLESSTNFVNTKCPKCGKGAKRETDTMDTFVDSSWYFFAFCDPPSVEAKIPYNKDIINYWGNVDQYIGGIEHAIMHLIYARFFTKVTRDLGLHKFDEPFQALLTQGMINKVHPYCSDCNAFLMEADLKKMKCKICGNTDLIQKSVKMSKSYGNTVDPGEIIEKYGADAARFFILFGASPSSGLEWSEEGVDYAYRFIKNTFILVSEPPEIIREDLNVRDTLVQYYLNKTIKNFTENMNDLAIRNAVNNIIQFTSELGKYKIEGVNKEIYNECLEKLTLLLHPIAPHMTEEIWEKFGRKGYLSLASWPIFNKELLNEESDYKWKLMNSILEDINNIRSIVKKESFDLISLIIADSWKLKFYDSLMILLEETINQGDIMKDLLKNNEFKKHSSQIAKIVSNILRNIGKYSKFTLSSDEEFQFFTEIIPIIERKFDCKVKVIFEKDSKESKAKQSLPGKPAIIIK